MKRQNILIDKYIPQLENNTKNALSKARMDVEKTCVDLGFLAMNIKTRNLKTKYGTYLYNAWQYLKCLTKISFNSNVYIQYPAPLSRISYYNYLITWAKCKKCKIIYIIHDLEFLRYRPEIKTEELLILNKADSLIVHNQVMKEVLVSYGINVPMSVLNIFDYYATETRLDVLYSPNRLSVAFAGNLMKSKFLVELIKHSNSSINYSLYGQENVLEGSDNPNFEYCGAFSPNNIPPFNVAWGLVWDGDRIDTCSGILGNYLRFNSSHKLSLYIAAGIPVIVWEDSAIAEYIHSMGLGICVKDLYSLPDRLASLSKEEYETIQDNVRIMATKLRTGEMLKNAIKNL